MTKKNERISFRISPSTKHAINKIPEDNSKWLRDIINRELNNREIMKDEKKKIAPVKIERIKELNNEIKALEKDLSNHKSRLEEIQKTISSLEDNIAKKKSLKQKIKDEVKEETDMDDLLIKQAVGDLK